MRRYSLVRDIVQPAQLLAALHPVARFFQQFNARSRYNDAVPAGATRTQKHGGVADPEGVHFTDPARGRSGDSCFLRR